MSRHIAETIMTPGWAEIVALAEGRLNEAKLAALNTRDPQHFAELHRRAWAQHDALFEFLQKVEKAAETGE